MFIGHSGPVSAIAMSPDGRYLASAGKLDPFLSDRQPDLVIISTDGLILYLFNLGEELSINLWDLST